MPRFFFRGFPSTRLTRRASHLKQGLTVSFALQSARQRKLSTERVSAEKHILPFYDARL